MQKLKGVFCALWTPADSDGEVLWPELEKHVDFLISAGIHGFMALGSTAEFPHLSITQRKQILKRLTRRKLPIIANVSDVSHRNVIALAHHAKEVGATAIAVLPPWFFPMAQRDLAEFFIKIAKEAEMPLVLYNFPEVTGKKIEIETIRRTADAVHVVAVKQSGGEFDFHHKLHALGKEMNFSVLTGADTRLEEALKIGCTGTVSGLANAVPEVLIHVYKHYASRERSAESRFLSELGKRMSTVEFPLNVKAAIAARGFETGVLKNPASAETLASYESLKSGLEQFFATSPALRDRLLLHTS
ncbi:MAG TPA: dihydrodipicolinate synthase family protein [Candidatus Kapabacteria bacterium]|nr:dihydrodipicolinate synthase family protein [Candidatus Kapabacteria bacterium]